MINDYLFLLNRLHGFEKCAFLFESVLFTTFIVVLTIGLYKIVNESLKVKIK